MPARCLFVRQKSLRNFFSTKKYLAFSPLISVPPMRQKGLRKLATRFLFEETNNDRTSIKKNINSSNRPSPEKAQLREQYYSVDTINIF